MTANIISVLLVHVGNFPNRLYTPSVEIQDWVHEKQVNSHGRLAFLPHEPEPKPKLI